MKSKTKARKAQRDRRRVRVRKKVAGTPERPRLSVCRTLSNIHAQLVDDANQVTLASASTLNPDIREQAAYGGNIAAARLVGAKLAERAQAQGVKRVCFDRGGNSYHGRVKAVADAARKGGLDF